MIGALTKTIAEFLRNTEIVKENSIPVYTANTVEGRFTVNTSLPAILVTVAPSEYPTVFISGNILDRINIHIRYMDDLLNYTMSEDDGMYEQRRDYPYRLRDEIWNNKQGSYFKQFMNVNGLNIMYKGMTTYTQVGVLENLSKDIDVFSFIFSCNLFSDDASVFPTVPLEQFFIELVGSHVDPLEPVLQTVTASGEKFVIWNSVEGDNHIKSLEIHGKTVQNGKATPLNPINLVSAGENNLVLYSNMEEDIISQSIEINSGLLCSVFGNMDVIKFDSESGKWNKTTRIGVSKGFKINSFTAQESNGDLRFVRINGSVIGNAVSPNVSYFLCNKFYYTGDSTSNKWNNVYGVYTNSLRYGFYVVYDINDYPTEDDLKAMIEDESTIFYYVLENPVESEIVVNENIRTYDSQTWIMNAKQGVNPRMVCEAEVTEVYDYVKDGLIAYYTGRGRTNTDENKNILPDLSGNGNDLENKNFAYTINSGYGDGYIQYDGIDDFSMLPLGKNFKSGVKAQMFVFSATQSTTETDNKWNGGIVREHYFAIQRNQVPAKSDYEQVYLNGTDVKTTGFKINGSTEINTIVISKTKNVSDFNKNLNISTILNAPVYCIKQRFHDALLYDRKLSDEEIEQNYKVSLQFNGKTL